MHRFYCPSQNISGDRISLLDKNQVHHLRDVLRLKTGDAVTILDDKSNEYNCIIEKLLAKTILIKIKNKYNSTPNKEVHITVACAIPKKSKFDDIVDKLTQLGVDRIIPLNTERVIIKLDEGKKILRQKRWQKIAITASQQSQRITLPVIESIKNMHEVLSKSRDFDLKLIPTLMHKQKSLKDIFAQYKPKNILILIGPEGDFTPGEVELAKKVGCIPVSLGDLVLRVDTAVIAVTSFIRLNENS